MLFPELEIEPLAPQMSHISFLDVMPTRGPPTTPVGMSPRRAEDTLLKGREPVPVTRTQQGNLSEEGALSTGSLSDKINGLLWDREISGYNREMLEATRYDDLATQSARWP